MALMFVFNFKKYFRFSVGGMTDVAEIKGHRFVGMHSLLFDPFSFSQL